jgi:uncharacterized protein CbrC (UPF0167 family)
MSNEDKTCEVCPDRRPAIVLAFEHFSSETKQWLCAWCWSENENHMTLVEYATIDDEFNALHADPEYWKQIQKHREVT